jgi:hypothetical protein
VSVIAVLFLVACSDDDDDEATAQSQVCSGVEEVRQDLDALEEAVQNDDRSAAEDAIEEARDHANEVREDIQSANLGAAAAQSASDFTAAVDALQTTLRQAGQGGASATGVVQQLEIQFAAMSSSLSSLRTELSSLSCN